MDCMFANTAPGKPAVGHSSWAMTYTANASCQLENGKHCYGRGLTRRVNLTGALQPLLTMSACCLSPTVRSGKRICSYRRTDFGRQQTGACPRVHTTLRVSFWYIFGRPSAVSTPHSSFGNYLAAMEWHEATHRVQNLAAYNSLTPPRRAFYSLHLPVGIV